MSFINWGGESSEMRAIRARLEQEALFEQAVRMANARNSAQFGGAGSAGISASTPAVSNLFFYLTSSSPAGVNVWNVLDDTFRTIGMLPAEPQILWRMAAREVSPGTMEITVVGSMTRPRPGEIPTYIFWRGTTTNGSPVSWQRDAVMISPELEASLAGLDWIGNDLYVALSSGRLARTSQLYKVDLDRGEFIDPISLLGYPLNGIIGVIGEGQGEETIVVSSEGALFNVRFSAAKYIPSTDTWTPLFLNIASFNSDGRTPIATVEARPGAATLLVNGEASVTSRGSELLIFDPVTSNIEWRADIEDLQNSRLVTWAAPSYSLDESEPR